MSPESRIRADPGVRFADRALAAARTEVSNLEPVVLLHAGIAGRRTRDPQWPGLTAGRDTVRLGLRGFGDSTSRPAGDLAPVDDVLATLTAR